jgi:hypothetical protein
MQDTAYRIGYVCYCSYFKSGITKIQGSREEKKGAMGAFEFKLGKFSF